MSTLKNARSARVVLVSSSPRRRELLERLGFRCEVVHPPGHVEELATGEPRRVVLENAKRKVLAYLAAHPPRGAAALRKVFLGVDTIVELRGRILGKPADADEARRMLERLSGRRHRVFSGLYLSGPGGRSVGLVASTGVRFRRLKPWEMDRYVASGEPMDKAGGYGIQGLAGLFVDGIDGCYYNVVGLPLGGLVRGLERLGIARESLMHDDRCRGRRGRSS